MGIIGEMTLKLKEVDCLSNLSPVLIEILNILDSPHTTVEEISRLVCLDKVLYANVFKYVSSAAFAMRKAPQTIEEAINYLGLYGLRDLIFILAARKMFISNSHWQSSVFIAFCAKRLAQKLGLKPNEVSNIYIAALMYDMGAYVLSTRHKQVYEKVLASENLFERFVLEDRIFGTNSIQLSYEILSSYDFPKPILNIIQAQSHYYDHQDYKLANAIIDLATQLGSVDAPDERDLLDIFSSEAVVKFGLASTNIDTRFIHKLNSEIVEFTQF